MVPQGALRFIFLRTAWLSLQLSVVEARAVCFLVLRGQLALADITWHRLNKVSTGISPSCLIFLNLPMQ